MAQDKKKVGRPDMFAQAVADKICEEIATTSRGLRAICPANGISVRTLRRWLTSNKEFCLQYARAKECQADYLAEEILEIADDSTRDTKTIVGKDGKPIEVENTEWTNRSRLRVDSRKWLAGKLKPKKYGDKLDIEAHVTVEQPLFPDSK